MNPLEFLQQNVFYTPERKQEINESLRRTQMLAPNTPTPPAPAPVMPGGTGNFLQDNIFYTPERKQAINQSLIETQSKNPAMTKPVPELAGGTGNFIQDNIFYTPERKAAINNSLVETQKKNPALTRSTPADAAESAARGLASGFASKPIPANPELKYTPSGTDSALRSLENEIGKYVPDFLKDLGRDAEKKGLGGLIPGAGLILPDQKPVIKPESKKRRFADLRGSETPGSDTPAADNSAADKAFSDAAKFQAERSAGTDTGSGDREVTRVAQTDNMDDNMKAWAAANPTLAANLVEKVDARRMKNPEYTQVGYDQARKQADPSYDPNARSQNFGPAADAGEYGRNLRLQGTKGRGPVVDGDLYADMIGGKEKPNAQDFAAKRIKQQIDAPGGALPASEIQNPIIPNTDGTPVDSELELANKTYAKQKYVRDPIKDMMVLVE